MTVLVLAVILGIVLTMSLGSQTEVESIGLANPVQLYSNANSTISGSSDNLVEKVRYRGNNQTADNMLLDERSLPEQVLMDKPAEKSGVPMI